MCKQPKTRFVWIDALRLMAGLSMLALHSASDPSGQPFPEATVAERAFPIIFRSFAYMARTELFIIISIFLLVLTVERRPRNYATLIREQSQRLLIPFLFWCVFFAFWSLLKAAHYSYWDARLNDLLMFREWLGYIFLGNVKYHMHFLPTLFGVILAFPLYKFGVRFPSIGLILFFLLALRRELDVLLWRNFSDMAGFDFVIRAVKIFCYTGYGFVAGAFYRVFIYPISRKQRIFWLWNIAWCGVLLLSIKLSHSYLIIKTGTWNYNYVPAYWADALMPCLLFVLTMLAGNGIWASKISKWAPYSFGIYLCHPIFIDIYETATKAFSVSPGILVSGKIIFTFVCTIIFVFFLRRIKWLSWTIGFGEFPLLKRAPKLRFKYRPNHKNRKIRP